MQIDYRGKGIHDKTPRAIITDMKTGRRITPCVFADDETGEYIRLVTDAEGNIFISPATKKPVGIHGKTKLKIELIEGE